MIVWSAPPAAPPPLLVDEAAGRWQLSPTLLRAIRICEGIGARGIAHVENPDAPISRVLGSATAVDTVRFARDTLARRAGDCDDTTVLRDGFASAWASASQLVRQHRDGVQFLSVRSGRAALKVRLTQGILHALYGRTKEAERIFSDAIRDDAGLVAPYANLANLRIIAGDPDGALEVLKAGLARHPASALLNYAMARCLVGQGNSAAADAYIAKVKVVDPALAARAEGPAGTGSPQRGKPEEPLAPAIWSADE